METTVGLGLILIYNPMSPTTHTSHNAVGEGQALWLLEDVAGHLGHLHVMAQGSGDGEFLKWRLTLGGMIVHILKIGHQVRITCNPSSACHLPAPGKPGNRLLTLSTERPHQPTSRRS